MSDISIEVIKFSIGAKSICSRKLLFHITCFCNPVQSYVRWTVAAMASVQEGYASAKRAGWDQPVKNVPATRTVRSTASARTGSVSAALDGKGTTAPLVRALCASRNKIRKTLTSYTKICYSHQSDSSHFWKKQRPRIRPGVKRCLCTDGAPHLSHRIAAQCSFLFREKKKLIN